MGGIGLSSTNLNRTPHTPVRTQYKITRYIHTKSYTCKHIYAQKQKYNMQHREHNTEHTENSTETNIPHTENNNTPTQPQQNSAHNYRTYSFDLYHEFAYINNSNTIELYTISKENI